MNSRLRLNFTIPLTSSQYLHNILNLLKGEVVIGIGIRIRFIRIFISGIHGSIFVFRIISQWVWFSMSTRNFIGSAENSAHP